MACGIVLCFKTRLSSFTVPLYTKEYWVPLKYQEILTYYWGGRRGERAFDKSSSIQPPQEHEDRTAFKTSPKHHWDVNNFYTAFVFGKKDTWIFSKRLLPNRFNSTTLTQVGKPCFKSSLQNCQQHRLAVFAIQHALRACINHLLNVRDFIQHYHRDNFFLKIR